MPVLHVSDLGSRKALRKFKEGQKVAARVLTIDAGGRGWMMGILGGTHSSMSPSIKPLLCSLSCSHQASDTDPQAVAGGVQAAAHCPHPGRSVVKPSPVGVLCGCGTFCASRILSLAPLLPSAAHSLYSSPLHPLLPLPAGFRAGGAQPRSGGQRTGLWRVCVLLWRCHW